MVNKRLGLILSVLLIGFVFAGFVSACHVITYSDSSYTHAETSFSQGDTVYGKGYSDQTKFLKIQYYYQNGTFAKECVSNTEVDSMKCDLGNAQAGDYTAKIFRKESGIWVYKNSATFTVNGPKLPVCEFNMSIRLSYGNGYGTGIAIAPAGTTNWISDSVPNLTKGESYDIKFAIDNEFNVANVAHIIYGVDGSGILDFGRPMDADSSTYFDPTLNTSTLSCGYHEIFAHIGAENKSQIECSLSDHASRQIYVFCNNTNPPTPYCGDGIINQLNETCDDGNNVNGDGCSSLCTIEQNNTETKTLGTTNPEFYCSSNWQCSGWSECNDGVQTRNCYDTNNCEVKYNMPSEVLDCSAGITSNVTVNSNGNLSLWFLIGIVIFLILIIILVNLLR